MNPRCFFVIGAQKSGTTALFEYLRHHPEVYMPPEKEAEFFTGSDTTPAAWAEYRRRLLTSPRSLRVVGTASPQYMGDPAVPARMAALVPDALLIAVLRDPVERAVSHYKMAVRRGDERRDFARAVREQLQPAALEKTRALPFREVAERDAYVVWGEYARILRGFLHRFSREQLLLVYSEDLRERPREALARVCRHLGIAEGYSPPNLGKLYHVGGARRKLPGLEKVLRSAVARGLIRLAVRKRRYKRMQMQVERWNAKPTTLVVPGETYAALADHYAGDVAEVSRLCGIAPRWFLHRGEATVTL
ncbi:MAG TPA: sulfotransferase [Gammaproteobacteria bacterium]|nr:sulfotransferase [Gammaproteobacteria bacterium]